MSKAMAKNFVRENVPLSRFGVLVAQLESIVASAAHKPPDPLLCFDLLSDLISAIEEEPKESILLWQRKCEDTLYSLLVLGARRPVRHLASVAMAKIISKGDGISIYSRASSLQGFLSDGKKSDAQKVSGAAQCLGELYRYFGRRIVSGLLETTNIVVKLLKFSEDFVRQEALHMLRNALEGSGGSANSVAYTEAFRAVTRIGVVDKSFSVRIAAARCLKAFANIGGPGIGLGELENCLSICVKVLEDPVKSVRDAFAEALGALLALGMNPDAQVQPRGKSHVTPKKLEGGLQKHLCIPFIKVSGPRLKDIRVGLSLSWVCFLQVICLKYFHADSELQDYALQVMDMLRSDTSTDAQALACVLYILRIGVTDQMSEPTQRGYLVFLGKQLQSPDFTPSMRVATLRTLSYVLKTLGEVPLEFKEVLDDTVVAALSHYSPLVRVEAALTLRALAEVDPSCVGGLISYAMTMLCAARENVSFEKASNFKEELESLHGQAAVLASLVSISRKLHLGYPARLPSSVLDVCKKLLMECSRNPAAAAVEKEAGWTILSSLLSSISKEELQDQVFDILSLWAPTFSRNPKQHINQAQDLASEICMWSAAMDALTSFIKCFVASDAINRRILLQPVLLYLNRALSYISQVVDNERSGTKPLMGLFIIRVLLTYQALSDPSLYKSDHGHIIQICTTPFREASKCEESSCLMMLLDKRDAWLGPWTPGRDWFEDELRSFLGGKDGVLTCVWENELPSFPQPETISKMLVNQMLLCFGTMFAFQDSNGMLKFIGMMDQCLKAGKRQIWHTASITNICVGLLAGLKTLLALRPEPLGMEILSAAQAIFQSILAEGDICASQRRASAEGLGLLARLGNDIFTARLTKLLLGDVTSVEDSNYTGSISLALGCIHRSAGGMALSSLVPTTVNVVSSLAKSPVSSLQIWSLHALILTIEAAGLSYVTHVQITLGLAMEILLSEESGLVDLQQAVGCLINAIVAVIGPELSPNSIFFSRCKSAIAEISSCQETATLLESVRFTQQLVLFAPQAVSVHCHVQTLLPTLISRQPTLRHLALSTLRHLIEKDPISIIDEQIEETLFHMLDEETNTEIGQLARTTIMRLLYASCPSRSSQWLSICRNMILSTSSRRNATSTSNNLVNSSIVLDGEKSLNFGEDDENMVSSSKNSPISSYAVEYTSLNFNRDKHLRYRTRVFAAECLNHLPHAVGENPAHFDLLLARQQTAKGLLSRDWLVLQLQELVSLAYQISTIQFEKMQPIGVSLLCTVMDKFAASLDPDLPDHVLLEQYQAQLVSAVRSALDSLSGPILLEAGLQLATKMLTSGIISRDQVAVKRIFSLIARPLDDFNGLYYPSYAEWVSCKIKIRLLTVHASLKCYMFAFLRKQGDEIPDEYLALLPLFSKSSSILGTYWLSLLNDYCFVRFHLHLENWKPFFDGIQTPVVSNELQPCLEEAWPVILQALVLDAVPANSNVNGSAASEKSKDIPISRYSMVELRKDEFDFLWGFLLMILFQEQDVTLSEYIIPVCCVTSKFRNDIPVDGSNSQCSKLYDIFFPAYQFMITERFFAAGFLTMDACKELLEQPKHHVWTALLDGAIVAPHFLLNTNLQLIGVELLHIVIHIKSATPLSDFGSLSAPFDLCRVSASQKQKHRVFLYLIFREDSWDSLGFSIFLQVIQKCPKYFLEEENFAYLTSELCLTSLFKILLSIDTNSSYSSSWETIISVPLITASTLLERAEPQMRLKLLLPFLLIGFKCIGEASTELYLARIFDFVKFIISLPKGHEKSELVADGITHLASIIRACLSATARFTKDCIDAIHQLENKSFHLRKILYLKLAFSVEQVFSLASLAFVFEGPGDSQESNPLLFRMLHHSIQCIQAMLADSDIQIQAVGLQVVKVILQKGIGAASNTFLIFFVGELVGDLLIIIQNVLEKHVKREAFAIAGESLKILTLLHTLSKGCDHQKGVINLLLEAILIVFSISDGSLSQEVHDLRSISIKIVSQLAQIPSSAVSVKEILLAMPATQRQQLQDIIRASVTQYQIPKPAESSGPALVIKLPSQTEQNETNSSLQLAPPKDSTEESDSNSTVEEDDDWDTFQSFPASRNGTAPAEEIGASCSDSSIGDSTSPSCGNKENLIAEDQDLNEGADNSNQMVEHHVTEEGSSGDNESYNFYQLSDNIEPSNSDSPELCNILSDQVQDEFETTVTAPSNENNQLSSDAIDIEIKEICRDPSDRHNTGSSHCNVQGLSEPQSTEIAIGHDEPSREDRHEDGTDINGRDNSVDCGHERLSLSTNYSLVVSTIEHTSQSKPDPLP